MFVIGFNLRRGIEPAEAHKSFGPPRVRGIGIGWSRSTLLSRADLSRALKEAATPADSNESARDQTT